MKSNLFLILCLLLTFALMLCFSCKPKPAPVETIDTTTTTTTVPTDTTIPPTTPMGNSSTHSTAHGLVTRTNQLIITDVGANDYFLASGGYVLAAANVGPNASDFKRVFCFAYRETDESGKQLIKKLVAKIDSSLQADSIEIKCYSKSSQPFYDIFSRADTASYHQQGLAVYVNELLKTGNCECLKDFQKGTGFFSALTVDKNNKAFGQIGGF
jgi:hypothetical protein